MLADAEKDRDYNYANWQECKQKVLQGNITFDELNAKIEHLMVTKAYYLQHNITLTDVAREVGSCRTYVSNYINKEMHCSFSDYVNRLRIEHAKMVMLQHARHGGASKFSVIAIDVGFSGEQSFYRNFRKFTGMTPLEWLDSQRRGSL